MTSFAYRSQVSILFIFFLFSISVAVYASEVDKFRDDLHSTDVRTRIKAATALAQAHDIDGVRAALEDNDAKVRHAAIYNLSISPARGHERRDPEAVAIFVDRLKDKDAHVRQAALQKLKDYDTEAFFRHHDMDPDICMYLTPLLSDPDKNVRYDAVMTVKLCGLEKIDEELLRIAKDKNETIEIRSAAIYNLRGSKIKDIDMQVLHFLDDSEDPRIKGAAISALGGLKSLRAVDKILPFVYDKNRFLQNNAIYALGTIGDPKAANALSDILIDDKGKVDILVLESLGKTSSPEILSRLLKIKPLVTEPHIKKKFADALGATGNENAVMPLFELIKDKNVGVQSMASINLEKFDSPVALKMIINEANKEPENLALSNLAKKAQYKLDFPEEVKKEKQKQKEYAFVVEKELEIVKIYYSALKLFKEKQYEKAIPAFYDAANQFEKLYAVHPTYFRSSNNKITAIRSTLGAYYRWKAKDINKAIAEYDELISCLKKYEPDFKRNTLYFFILGEIYEQDVKDYEKAIMYYKKVIEPFSDSTNIKGTDQFIADWYMTWINFLIERINVVKLKKQATFTKRTLKYPSLEYGFFSTFGAYLGGPPAGFLDEDILSYEEKPQGAEVFDRLYERYPDSFRMMFLGITLFHQFSMDNKLDSAYSVAEKVIEYYPYDLHTIILCLELADLYKSQNNEEKYKKYLDKGLQTAQDFNVELIMGPDPRFASPEDTWRLHVESLKKGDIETAVECFSPYSSRNYKEMFTLMKDKLPEIASEMRSIQLIKRDAESAEYSISRMEEGQETTFGVVNFVNIFNEWKIVGY